MRFVYTQHAETVTAEREITKEWIERTISDPSWTSRDPLDTQLTRAFLAIAERDNRVLRVVYARSESEIRIISAFFDRGAKRPQ